MAIRPANTIVAAGLMLVAVRNTALAQNGPLPAKLMELPAPAPAVSAPALPADCVVPYAAPPRGLALWKQKLQDCFLGRPEEFVAVPLGWSTALHFQTQVANGVAARMVLHDYDFVCGTDRLNLRGQDRLRQIACLLPQTPYLLVIERTPRAPELAEARRLAVVNELLQASVPVSMERVVVGPPLAVPLHGIEAERIFLNYLLQIDSAGFRPPTGVGVGGGTTGGAGAGGAGFGGR